MSGLFRAARHTFGTKRGLQLLAGNVLVAFGGISAAIQFVGQLFPKAFPAPGTVTVASLGFCFVWGLARAYPRARVLQEFKHPEMVVVVEAGDLFEKQSHLVVGFSDTFDTTVGGFGIVSGASVQGQLLDRVYEGDRQRLDRELTAALRGTVPESRETRERKLRGKLNRYPIGTVAVLGERPRLVFGLAYSRIGNDYVAKSTVEELWFSLNRLWDAVYEYGEQEHVAMPLIGSGLARLDFLDRENLLRLILLSFVTRSRERRICRELRVVISPPDLERIDMPEIGAFLRALGSEPTRP